MSAERRDSSDAGDLEVSLVRNDLLFRAQRAVGLIPAAGFGVGRRALLLALVTWLPIAAWAVLTGRALSHAAGEPLSQHFGIHVRCLVAIPLLVVAEVVAHARTALLGQHFVRSGIVAESDLPRFREIVRGVARLRDASLPWIAVGGILVAWTTLGPIDLTAHEIDWATESGSAPAPLGFGGWWFLYVVRPIFMTLLLAWLWRLVLLCVLLRRIVRLDLSIVPTHPDRAGGLGFLERLPSAFGLVVFSVSAVLASRWGHDVLYHGVAVQSLAPSMGALLGALVVLFLAPLAIFAPRLAAAKRRALFDYGALVGQHGRLVHRRWILGRAVTDDRLLTAPELGPVADTLTLYDAVKKMLPAPISRGAVSAVLVPAVLPLVAVLAIQIPLRDLLLKLLKALV